MFADKLQDAGNTELAAAQISMLQEQLDELKRQLRVARGTADVTREAAQVVTLAQRVEQLLRQEIMTLDQLARELEVPAGKVVAVLREHKASVHNVGSEDRPRWTWKIGDQTPTRELTALVLRLITDQPMTTAELVQATGARASRVGGSIVEIQRSGAKVLDLGTGVRSRWFVLSAHARDARLPPKK